MYDRAPFALLAAALLAALPRAAAALELGERERAGKKIYRECTSPSGRDITATLAGDPAPLPASAIPCAGCHGDDGLGKPEGGVVPSAVTWAQLTKPYGHVHAGGRQHRAYDEATVARAVLEGRDPDGRELAPAMPRYSMPPEDVESLVAYLKVLDRDLDPGIDAERLLIATVLPTSGRHSDLGAAIRGVLDAYVVSVNAAGGIHGRRVELDVAGFDGDRGDALEALRRLVDQRPPFALVSGFAGGAESQVAAFADEGKIPLVAPFTIVAQGGEDARHYVFHALSGVRELSRALAAWNASAPGAKSGVRAAVLHPDHPALADAARAARAQFLARSGGSVAILPYERGRLDLAAVRRARRSAGEVVLFLGDDHDLASFTRHADALRWAPRLLAPGTLAARAAADAPSRFAGRVFLAYPSLPGDEKPAAARELARLQGAAGIPAQHRAAQVSAYAAATLLTDAARRAGKALSRERLVATLESLHAYETGIVPPLTFGPSRRIGALGAYIVAVDVREHSFRPVSPWIALE